MIDTIDKVWSKVMKYQDLEAVSYKMLLGLLIISIIFSDPGTELMQLSWLWSQ